jgi:pilus assembly protein Flp/PilA
MPLFHHEKGVGGCCRNNRRLTMNTMIRLLKDEDGATAIEYGLIAALISVAAIGAMTALGTQLSTLFGNVSTNLAR